MKRKVSVIIFIALVGAILAGQTRSSADSTRALIAAISKNAAELFLKQGRGTLIVADIRIDAGPSQAGSFMAGAITTELANLTAGKKGFQVVSRQHVQDILEELSFQMSDLADPATRSSVGRLAGADLILAGSSAASGGKLTFNIQLISVESGAVRGGFLVDFSPDEEFRRLAETSPGSQTLIIREAAAPTEGLATRTEILETFDSDMAVILFHAGSDSWGEREMPNAARADTLPRAGRDGGEALAFIIEGDAASLPTGEAWDDYGVEWRLTGGYPSAMLSTGAKADGIALSLKPMELRNAYIGLYQELADSQVEAYVELSLEEGSWQDIKIPFASFSGIDGFVEDLPFNLSLRVGYIENHLAGAFQGTGPFSARILVDDAGLYAAEYGNQAAREIEAARVFALADGIERAPVAAKLSGAVLWQPLSQDWTPEGPPRRVLGLTVESFAVATVQESGRSFKRILARLRTDQSFQRFLVENPRYEMYIEVEIQGIKGYQGFSGMEITAGSPSFKEMYLALISGNGEEEVYHAVPLPLGTTPSKRRIPFSQLKDGDGRPLTAMKDWRAQRISISGSIQAKEAQRLIKDGILPVGIDIYGIFYVK